MTKIGQHDAKHDRLQETRDYRRGEDAPSLVVRCPDCRGRFEFHDSDECHDVLCPECGEQFRLTSFNKDELVLPKHLDNFRLIQRLGQGAFGTVWKARDTTLQRFVAIKVPRQGTLDFVDTEMFLREARTVAKLSHPHIVRVHEIGREDETIYIVSELVDGLSLAEYMAEQPPTIREAAQLCATIAKAMHYAHEQGVVHRDLKPTNVMIDRQGRPHIMDFGLAKRETTELTVTTDGEILGTPAYMSPEQAAGESHAADRRSDVYSVGVILFQLMTGELPFRGNFDKLIKQIINDPPPRPAKFEGRVPRDLETISLKALEKSPARRYDTAADLASDLDNWLAGLPIRARPVGPTGRLLRYCGRRPWTAASWLAAILSITLIISGICRVTFKRDQRMNHTVDAIDDFSHVQQSSEHLQTAAANTDLQLMLADRDLVGLQQFCHNRLETTISSHAEGAHFASWYVLDEQGVLLALSPEKRDLLGRNFRHRDYFQGASRRHRAMGVSAIHISRVFLSENDGLYKFAISAPVRDQDDQLLGVVVASLATDFSTAIELNEALLQDVIFWGLLSTVPLALLGASWVGRGLAQHVQRAVPHTGIHGSSTNRRKRN